MGRIIFLAVLFLVIIAVLGAAVYVFVWSIRRPVIRSSDSYQAVFLDNGQVYFGKLHSTPSPEIWSLKDIYYLRAGTVQQAGNEGTSQIDLIKLGAELHSPKDEMLIRKEHVIFYEDVGDGSEVMKLIRKHKQGK